MSYSFSKLSFALACPFLAAAAQAQNTDIRTEHFPVDVPVYICTSSDSVRLAIVKISNKDSLNPDALPVIETYKDGKAAGVWNGIMIDISDVRKEADEFCKSGKAPNIYRLLPPPAPR